MRQRTVNLPVTAMVVLTALSHTGCEAPAGRAGGATTELVVFAAASLADVASELAVKFEQRENTAVVFNFAGSNTLAQQIYDAGAADVFLSADSTWAEFLEDRGLVLPGSRRALLSNRMVIVGHRDTSISIDQPLDLLRPTATDSSRGGFRYLAVADPSGVPAGRYARRLLRQVEVPGDGNLWDALSGRLAPTLDVRAALALAESDPLILSVVYRTDAASSPDARILYEFPPDPEQPIRYWGLQVAGSPQPAAGERFLDFLASAEATELVAQHGFELLPQGALR